MVPLWEAHQIKGRMLFARPTELKLYVESLGDNKLVVKISKHRKSTTPAEFKYYFGVVLRILSDHIGFTTDEMDVCLRNRFLYEYKRIPGEDRTTNDTILKRVISKTAVSTVRFEKFLEEIRQWAITKLNVYIPLPNEVSYSETGF